MTTRIPPVVFDGCASMVSMLCLTFWNGRPYIESVSPIAPLDVVRQPGQPTWSFSTMLAGPWCCSASNVNIESAFCDLFSEVSGTALARGAYVEGSQLRSIIVESLIIEIAKLLWTRLVS